MAADPKRQPIVYASAGKRAEEHQGMGMSTCLKLPEGLTFFQPKAQTYMLDFMPYIVKHGNSHAKPGTAAYERTYCRHERIGGGDRGQKYVCLNTGWGEPCIICNKIQQLQMKTAAERTQAEQYIVEKNKLKERQMFLVIDTEQANKKLQLFEYSYHLFGKKLDALIKGAMRIKGTSIGMYDAFYRPDDGYTLRVTFGEKAMPNGKCMEAVSIEFHKRSKNYPESVIYKSPILDDLLVKKDAAELKKVFLLGMGGATEEEAPAEDNPYSTDDVLADDYATYDEVPAEDAPAEDAPTEEVSEYEEAPAEDTEVAEQTDEYGAETADDSDQVSEYVDDGDAVSEYTDTDAEEAAAEEATEEQAPAIEVGEWVKVEHRGKEMKGQVTSYAASTGMFKVKFVETGAEHFFEAEDLTVTEAPPKKPAQAPAKKPAAPAATPAKKPVQATAKPATGPAKPAQTPAKKPAAPAATPAKKPQGPLPGKRPTK